MQFYSIVITEQCRGLCESVGVESVVCHIVNVLHLLYVSCLGSVIKERNQIFFAISFFAGRLVLSKFVGLNNLVSIT